MWTGFSGMIETFRAVAFIGAVCLCFGVVAPGQSLTVSRLKVHAGEKQTDEAFTVSSDAVIMGCSTDGLWGLWTLEGDPDNPDDDNLPLTYARHGFTNGLSVMVDGTLHVLDEQTGSPDLYITDPIEWNSDLQAAFISWEIDGLQMQERLELVQSESGRIDTVKATYTITNPAGRATPAIISLKVGIDTGMGFDDTDRGVLAAGSGFVLDETGFGETGGGGNYANPVPNYYRLYDAQGLSGGLIGEGTLVGDATTPDKLVIGEWYDGLTAGLVFDYAPNGESYEDSAVGMWWFDRAIAVGESDSFVVYYGMGASCQVHSVDQNSDWQVQVAPELTRLVQFYSAGGYHCESGTEDGYAPGPGDTSCPPHNADQNGDWEIQVAPELTRIVQFYSANGYHCEPGTEDGYAPGLLPGTKAVDGDEESRAPAR